MADRRPARIIVPFGPQGRRHFDVTEAAVIGRSSRHPIVIEDRRVSTDHAKVGFDAELGAYVLEDLGSTNGTALDGVPITAPERLGALHVITIAGAHEMVFHELAAGVTVSKPAGKAVGEQTAVEDFPVPILPPIGDLAVAGTRPDEAGLRTDLETTDVRPVAMPMLPPELAARDGKSGGSTESAGGSEPPNETPLATSRGDAAPSQAPASPPVAWVLQVLDDEGQHQALPISGEDLCIGRGADADLRIDSLHLSRRHAGLRIEGTRMFIRDLGSSNATYVDGRRVTGEVEVEPGTALELGDVRMQIVAASGHEDDQGGSER